MQAPVRLGSLHRPGPAPAPPGARARRGAAAPAAAGKSGFGQSATPKKQPKKAGPSKKGARRGGGGGGPPSGGGAPMPPPPRRGTPDPGAPSLSTRFRDVLQEKATGVADPQSAQEFEKRLAALAADAEARKAELAAAKAAAGPVFDGTPLPDYDNPPPLATTLATAAGADPAAAGSAPASAVAASLFLVAVFVFTTFGTGGGGGDLGDDAPPDLTPETRQEVEAALAGYESTLAASPADGDALRGAAAAGARLGRPPAETVALLTRLTDAEPTNSEAWYLLGEAKLRAGDAKGAVGALERGRAEAPPGGPPDLALASTLARARVRAGNPRLAVDELKAERATAEASVPGSGTSLGLLAARALAEWPGHAADAEALYNELTAVSPDDYRVFLAKGILLRAQGRPADARRALLQARFLAPPSERTRVAALLGADAGPAAPPLKGGVGGGKEGGGKAEAGEAKGT